MYGSVLQGRDTEGSDLDLLVDPLPGTTLFDLGGLQDELEELMGLRVDVRTPKDLPASFRAQVLAEARPVMNENRLPDYLQHMRQAAADAVGFVEGMSRDEFLADKRTQQAVVMSLIVLGEAATKVMDRYPRFRQRPSADSLAQHARHAQPDRARILRYRSGRGLGYGSKRAAGVAGCGTATAGRLRGLSFNVRPSVKLAL